MKTHRSSGVLLHPTSLPSAFGIGDLGDGAYRFVEWLERAGQRVWQVLPLGPTGYGDSPYQSFSTFAGNWLLVSPERLVADGVLNATTDFTDGTDLKESKNTIRQEHAVGGVPAFPTDKVDFGWVIDWKRRILKQAADSFFANEKHSEHEAFDAFCRENNAWLSDYTFFMAAKEAQNGAPWNRWDAGVAKRYGLSLHEWGLRLAEPIRTLKFAQFQLIA